MGERKVLNKYFPPDFDPAKLPRGKREKDNAMKVRMMLPMSVRCTTCGTYMYKGTKFNMRKEDALGENYLGIQVFRFYWRCSRCAAEVTMKTDPKNSDYSMEHGATRNYEPWRDTEKTTEEAIRAREEEEKGNAMKALENRTLDSKREMDIMTALDEMVSLNARHERVDTDMALAALKRSVEEDGEPLDEFDEEDEAALKEMLLAKSRMTRRLDDNAPGASLVVSEPAAPQAAASQEARPVAKAPARPKLMVLAKRKAPEALAAAPPPQKRPELAAGSGQSAVEGNGNAAAANGANGAAENRSASPAGSEDGGLGALMGLGSYGSDSGGDSPS